MTGCSQLGEGNAHGFAEALYLPRLRLDVAVQEVERVRPWLGEPHHAAELLQGVPASREQRTDAPVELSVAHGVKEKNGAVAVVRRAGRRDLLGRGFGFATGEPALIGLSNVRSPASAYRTLTARPQCCGRVRR